MSLVYLTHPICASLDHPLFAYGGKRVKKGKWPSKPSLPLAEERVNERSDVRVS
jgi:hypothetical protein